MSEEETVNEEELSEEPEAEIEQQPSKLAQPAVKTINMPERALAKLKHSFKEKGRRVALSEFEQQIKAAGFDSMGDMLSVLKELKAKNYEQPQKQEPVAQQKQQGYQPQKNSYKEQQKYARQLELERQAKEKERRARMSEERKRRELEREKKALEAERDLERIAMKAGVSDVDTALYHLKKELANKSPQELEKFNEHKYFEQLRDTRPHLFGEVMKPVTTGTGAGNAPPSPGPGAVTKQAVNDAQVDAKDMSQKDFRELLRKRGLEIPL